jgi:hypothetical protein
MWCCAPCRRRDVIQATLARDQVPLTFTMQTQTSAEWLLNEGWISASGSSSR